MSNLEGVFLFLWFLSPIGMLYVLFRLHRKLSVAKTSLQEASSGRDLYLQKYLDLEEAARGFWSKPEKNEEVDQLSLVRSTPSEVSDASAQNLIVNSGVVGDGLAANCSREERDGPVFFAYIDAKENIDIYTIGKPRYSTEHVSGYCETASGFRSFRRDRLIKYFDKLGDAEEYKSQVLPSALKSSDKSRDTSSSTKKKLAGGSLDICFTGFSAEDKLSLQKLAMENGMVVRTRVTANLAILCCGHSAGPRKIEEAKGKGVVIADKLQFINFLKTGEVPIDAN